MPIAIRRSRSGRLRLPHVAAAGCLCWLILSSLALLVPEVQAQSVDSTLNRRFQLAESFLAAGQFDRAVPLLEDLYQQRPDAYVFYDRLKRAYENLKQFDDAIALVEDQIERTPLAVHIAEKARLLFLKGDTEEADATWDEAIQTLPLDPSTYRTVYLSMYQVRQFDAAIAVLENGRAKLGNEASFHADLAALHILNGEYERAVAEYVALLQKDERQLAYVRSRLAAITEEPQALAAAVSVTERAVRQAPTVRSVRELMAWLYLEGGRYLEALNAFRALDQLGEKDGRALFAFAQQAGDAGAFDAASEAYAELLDRYPDTIIAPDALYGLAALNEQWAEHLREHGDPNAETRYQRALATYRDYLDRFENHAFAPNARYRIARLQWNAFGDRAGARETLQELVKSAPSHPVADEARLDLGMIAVEEGKLSEARAAFARIVE
ncbi:MAG TPA: tetratricopeptide repeat protein, partial [Rhodothermales bacterium]